MCNRVMTWQHSPWWGFQTGTLTKYSLLVGFSPISSVLKVEVNQQVNANAAHQVVVAEQVQWANKTVKWMNVGPVQLVPNAFNIELSVHRAESCTTPALRLGLWIWSRCFEQLRLSPKIPLIMGRAIRGCCEKTTTTVDSLHFCSHAQPTTACRGRVSCPGQGLSLWIQTPPAGQAKSLLLRTHTLQI